MRFHRSSTRATHGLIPCNRLPGIGCVCRGRGREGSESRRRSTARENSPACVLDLASLPTTRLHCSTSTSSTTTPTGPTAASTNVRPTTGTTSPRLARAERSSATTPAPDSSTSTAPPPEPAPRAALRTRPHRHERARPPAAATHTSRRTERSSPDPPTDEFSAPTGSGDAGEQVGERLRRLVQARVHDRAVRQPPADGGRRTGRAGRVDLHSMALRWLRSVHHDGPRTTVSAPVAPPESSDGVGELGREHAAAGAERGLAIGVVARGEAVGPPQRLPGAGGVQAIADGGGGIPVELVVAGPRPGRSGPLGRDLRSHRSDRRTLPAHGPSDRARPGRRTGRLPLSGRRRPAR